MNLHPSILAQAAFSERPRSRRQLTNATGLIEGKLSVLKERQENQPVTPNFSRSNPRGREPSRNARTGPRSVKCWSCGHFGHVRRDCRQKAPQPGKWAKARRAPGPRAGSLNALRKIAATLPSPLLWVGLEMKAGKVAALLETGAQFSCIRSEVLRYLNQRGEDFTLLPCSLTCLLADGKKLQVEMRLDCAFVFWNLHGITYSRSLMRAPFRPSWA